MTEKGFLIVFSEPGNLVSLEEFQDWYNNEHVPLRMNHLSAFLTGARYSSCDHLPPSWVAMYDITSTSLFSDPAYTKLRTNRSPREADLVQRLEILDRRTCVALKDTGVPPKDVSTSFASDKPIEWVLIQGVDGDEEQFTQWTESVFSQVKLMTGWTRSRTFRCYDNLIAGTAVKGKGPEAQKVPKFLVLHELLSPKTTDRLEFREAIVPPPDILSVVEYRLWKLYRAYPGIAQGNLT